MQSTVSTMSHWTCMNTYACLSLVNEFLTCRRIFCSISSSSHLPVCLESGTAPFHQAAQACATLSWFIPRCSGNVERFLLPFPVHFVIPLAWKPSPLPFLPHLLEGAKVYRLRRDMAMSRWESRHCSVLRVHPRHFSWMLELLQSCMFAYVKNI